MSAESTAGHLGRERQRQQLPEEVASYVRELIVSGVLRPGDFLRMDRIAEAVGVSNTPVREGLLVLSNQGFVRQIPRRGFVVAPFTRQDVRDLFWAQALIAGELAARAAEKVTTDQLARLEDTVKAYERAIAAEDHSTVVDLGHAFHRTINLAADSIRLAMLLGSVVRTLPLTFYSTIEGWVDASRDEHPQIVEALRTRNAKISRSLMEDHISHGAVRLIDTLEKRGLWSESPKLTG